MGMAAGPMISMGMQAKGAYDSAVSEKISNRMNAQIAHYQAAQEIQNGQTNVQNSELNTAHVKGMQRAALAANGVDLGVGSATDIFASTDLVGDREKTMIMDNALRTAWGYQVKEASYNAMNDQIHPGMAAFNSLLGSANSTAGKDALSNLFGSYGKTQSVSTKGMTAWAGGDSGGMSNIG